MNQNRREFLKTVGAASITLTAVGTATANGRDRYIVTTSGKGVRRRIEDAGFAVQHSLSGGVLLVVGTADAQSELADVNGVKHASRDSQFELEKPVAEEKADATTDEDFYPLQWDKQVTDVAEAHETTTGDGALLAIIDTGVDVDHPDLKENVLADHGRLFRYGDVTDDTTDVYGHGTHVAGIAAASDDGTTGVVGTAPDADVVSLRVFYYDEVDGETVLTTTTGDILLAIDYAADLGADGMNMSIGTPPLPPEVNATGIKVAYQRVVQSAVQRGSVVVVSAGNSDADLQHGGYFTVPNSVAGAMSISATGPNDERTFYSNYGTNEIDVGAPGGGYETLEKTLADDTEWPYPTNLVLSSVPPELYDGSYYAYFAGTSMAAPQVTGTVGLLRDVAPDARPEQVEQAIRDGAEGVNGQSSADLGAGRLNANEALDASTIN